MNSYKQSVAEGYEEEARFIRTDVQRFMQSRKADIGSDLYLTIQYKILSTNVSVQMSFLTMKNILLRKVCVKNITNQERLML